MRWTRLFLPVAALLAACSDQSAVNPDTDIVPPPTALAVRDAVSNDGSPGLYFLQPVVTEGAPTKPLNRDLLPSVEICKLDEITTGRPEDRIPTADTDCPQVVKTFEINSFQPTEESFRVNWDTDDASEPIDADRFYRIKVLVGDLELGFFDVNPQAPGASEVIDGFHSFNLGSVIAIGFYIEEGALCTTGDGTVIECIEFTCELRAVGCTFTLDDDPALPVLGLTIPPQGGGFPIPYENFRFERLDENLVECIEGLDSPGFGPCARVTPLGDLQTTPLEVAAIKSICIDYADVTDQDGIRRPYQMIKQSEDGTIKALAATSSTVCGDPTQTAFNNVGPRGMMGRLARVLRPVTQFFAPSPLRAIDLGRGGEMEEFSTVRFYLGYEVRYVEGSGGIGSAGGPLPGPLPKVQAIDEKGIPVAGALIHFSVIDGNGNVTPIEEFTDADGFASLGAWTLGDRGTNTVVASSFGGYDEGTFPGPDFDHMMAHEAQTGTVTFQATAVGAPAIVDPTDSGLTATVNTVLEDGLEVTVRDAINIEEALEVPGVQVTWTVTSGNGFIIDDQGNQVTTLSTVTGSDGKTSITFQLGTLAGENTVTATVDGLDPVTFTATGTPDDPFEIFKVSGDGQVAKIGTTLPASLVVDVRDGFGNVTGDEVSWSVPTGNGSTVTADPANPNSASLTLGGESGTYTATATLSSWSLEAEFTATACGPGLGLGTATVDGALDPDEWFCAKSTDLEVNLGGGTAQAKIYWMNDAENVYFGVWVDGADKVNSLRIDFDNEGDGTFAAGEDAINFDPSLAQADRYTDEYLTVQCANRSQAGCGELDPDAPDGSGAFQNAGGVTVYELSKALDSGDAVHDFVPSDLNANPAGYGISGFVTFRVGNGAKGNTQWPGFRVPHFFQLFRVP